MPINISHLDPEDVHSFNPIDNYISHNENKYSKRALAMFPLELPLRQWLIKNCAPGTFFDTFILIMILLNSILMACRDYRFVDSNYEPVSENSLRNFIVEKAEIMFTVIFILEFLMKVIAFGFVEGERAYLKSPWNILDFLIVMCR